jgi:hypothetical protein
MIPLRNERRRDGSNVESRINRWNIIGTSWRIVTRSASDRRPDARPSVSSSCLTCTTAPGRTHRQSTTVPDPDALPTRHQVFEPKTRSSHQTSHHSRANTSARRSWYSISWCREVRHRAPLPKG